MRYGNKKWSLNFYDQPKSQNPTYSASSLIRILAYPNSQKQDYNIIHKHFNDIHIVIELSVIYFSMHFTYPNFSVIRTNFFLLAQRGEDK